MRADSASLKFQQSSERILGLTFIIIFCWVLLFRVGRKLNPFQLVAVYEGTGVSAAGGTGAFRDKLHADGFHLFLKIEVFEVLHAHGVEDVAEIAQTLDVDALSLRHTGVHHACDVAQHGLYVRVADR